MLLEILNWLKNKGIKKEAFEIFEDIIYPTKQTVIDIHNVLVEKYRDEDDTIHTGAINEANIEHNLSFVINRVKEKHKLDNIIIKASYLLQ